MKRTAIARSAFVARFPGRRPPLGGGPTAIGGRAGRLLGVAAGIALLLSATTRAMDAPRDDALGAGFDARVHANSGWKASAGTSQVEAAETLRGQLPGLTVTYDPWTGGTRTLHDRTGYLTVAPDHPEDSLAIATAFLRSHRRLLGLTERDLDGLEVIDLVPSTPTGATHVYLGQRHAGISVYLGQVQIHVNRDGRVLAYNSQALPDLQAAVPTIEPAIDAAEAVLAAAAHLGVELSSIPIEVEGPTGPDRRGLFWVEEMFGVMVEARLALLPVRQGRAELVWNFQLPSPDRRHHYDLTVDTLTGQVWTRYDWVANDSYRVYPRPVESPSHADPPAPTDGRILVVDPADELASPLGWHDTGLPGGHRTTTRGNNVHAYVDPDADDEPPPVDVDCGGPRSCDFPLDFGAHPTASIEAAVTNLFFWNNLSHDVHYRYGFDEVAGNFQTTNFGRGGSGADAVRAEALDGSGYLNASFLTPPEGMPPRMQMFVWNLGAPDRDSDFDNAVIVHEYGHGVSNRLVGGPSTVSCLGHTQTPAEGVSDWWALAWTHRPGDRSADPRSLGTYLLFQPPSGPGIRSQPYSTDPAVNDLVLSDLAVGDLSVPHGTGEVWAQAAWEVYWAFVDRHGFDPDIAAADGDAGNQRMMLYVTEGLKNAPCQPTFGELRDAILLAAIDNHGGADVCRMWRAFAGMGLGVDADSGGPFNFDVTDGFAVPPECECPPIDPPAGVTAAALDGGHIRIDWSPDPSAGSYRVFRAPGTCEEGRRADLLASDIAPTHFVDFEVGDESWSYRVSSLDAVSDCESPLGLCVEIPSFELALAAEKMALCVPDEASTVVEVTAVAGFNDPVAVSVGDLPPGVTASVEPERVIPEGVADLTLSASEVAGVGAHALTVQAGGGNPLLTRDSKLGLRVFDRSPSAPELRSPPDGASEVPLAPELRWGILDQAGSYRVQVARDAAFDDVVFDRVVSSPSAQVESRLDQEQRYYWRVQAENSCGSGPSSPTASFSTTRLHILLVDDDDDRPDLVHSYGGALDGMGLAYDVWNTEVSAVEPELRDLSSYTMVVWFSGDVYGGVRNPLAGPTAESELALEAFLALDRRCLAIISQDYLWDRGGPTHDVPTPFMIDFLGLGEVGSDAGPVEVTGVGRFGDAGHLPLRYPFRNYGDQLVPGPGGQLGFVGEDAEGEAFEVAVAKDGGTYRTTFWGFPFEAVPTAEERQRLMATLVAFCTEDVAIFADGFESGDLSAWNLVVP